MAKADALKVDNDEIGIEKTFAEIQALEARVKDLKKLANKYADGPPPMIAICFFMK